MHFLISALLIVLSALAFFYLKRSSFLDIKSKESDLASLSASLHQAFDEKRELENNIFSLSNSFAKTVKMYEAARDICVTLEETKLVERFREDLGKLVGCDECEVLKADSNEPGIALGEKDLLLPLELQDMKLGYLYVKGIPEGQRQYLDILAKNFCLGLKRSKLYRITQELAITDSLTGLYTRRYAMERLREELRRPQAQGSAFTFLMIDADNFKECNDRFGHLVGDMVLIEISRRIRESIREVDLLARFGGEEFMVVAPKTGKEAAFSIAERIRRCIEDSLVQAYDEKLKATVSIGLASYPVDATSMEDLIGKADWALYEAKKLGKNKVCVFGKFHE